jgi:hypothetical protein
MKYLPWLLLATALSYPLIAQGTLTKERIICLTPEQEEILSHMSIVYLDDGSGNLVNKTIRFERINVQIVNGLGATNGYPKDPDSVEPLDVKVDGVGNLIVGYNELGNPVVDDRTGSHNMVLGHGNSYSSFGGFAGPHDNTSSAPFASVTGGTGNEASGVGASVVGGEGNTAGGNWSTVSGGRGNLASGFWSAISGGKDNSATDTFTSVSGGDGNTASNNCASVSGGVYNEASGYWASVSGGRRNQASGCYFSSISGGAFNTAGGYYGNSVSGGLYNTADGEYSSVSGGISRSVTGSFDWRAGSLFEDN